MTGTATSRALRLPGPLQRRIDRAVRSMLTPDGGAGFDFRSPAGEPALTGPDSVSWRIFRNPVSLFIGGVAAVILELSEPAVRAGVWEHSRFREDPLGRLKRTGLAAMVTVYGARSRAEAMIGGVVRLHGQVRGRLPDGRSYRASDPDLLAWVQATAGYGFAEAYHRFVAPLGPEDRQCLHDEGRYAARLYGATHVPASEHEREAYFRAMTPRLEPSPVIDEFLAIMRRTRLLPVPMGILHGALIRAAVDLVPPGIAARIGLDPSCGTRAAHRAMVGRVARLADRLVIGSSPAVEACRRLGLPDDHLWRRQMAGLSTSRPE